MDLNLPEKRVFLGPANLWKRVLAFILDLFILDFFVLGFFRGVTSKVVGSATSVTAAYHMLQERAAKITDKELRHLFLEDVAAHREIAQEFARAAA